MSRTAIHDDVLEVEDIRPVADYVLLKVLKREKTSGGIHLVGTSATECTMGEVIAVGQGVWNNILGGWLPIELNPGDHVLTMDYMGERVELRDGKYRLVRSYGIWAKVTFKDEITYELTDLEPRAHSVLVEPADETKTRSGLLFLPNAKNATAEKRLAKVIKVGPGQWHSPTAKRIPLEVKPGDQVIMTRYAGADVWVNGKLLRLCQEDDIASTYEEDK